MNIFDRIHELANRPTCHHNLNGPCGTCGLPPHETLLPEEMVFASNDERDDPDELWF